MNWVLALLLFILVIYEYYSNQQDMTYPSVLLNGAFLLSSVFLALNTYIWDYVISGHTVIVICLALGAFSMGCRLSQYGAKVSSLHNTRTNVVKKKFFQYQITTGIIWAILFLQVIAIIFRILDLYSTVGSLNIFSGNAMEIFRHKGDYFLDASKYSIFIKLFNPIMQAIGLTFIFLVLDNISKKVYFRKLLYFPVIGYFLYFALSSARIEVVYTFSAIAVIYIFIQHNVFNKKLNRKQIQIACAAGLGLFVFFWILGFLTGKSQQQTSFFDNISIYAGSSIAIFDHMFKTFTYSSSNIGTYTFDGIAHLLGWLHIQAGSLGTGIDEFYRLGRMSQGSNIATALRALVYDYNYIGMYCVMFVEGVFLGLFYQLAKRSIRKGKIFWVIFYAYMSELILFSSCEERIMSTVLTISMFIFIIFAGTLSLLIHTREFNQIANIENGL